MEPKHRYTAIALHMGILVPFAYFGVQLAAAPFYPGYSFLTRDASTLGSDGSTFPLLFNAGAIATGILTLIAATGFFNALRRIGTPRLLVWATSLALVSTGMGSINAGIFPLPDPRHNPGALGAGMFLLPMLLPAAIWKVSDGTWVRRYLIGSLAAFVVLIPIMGGLIQRAGFAPQWYQDFLNGNGGLLQRIAALVVFVPIGVVAYRIKAWTMSR